LIGDKAYDSDALDAALAERGIEMIYRSNRIAKTQDGRSLEAAMEDRTHEQLVAEPPPRLRAQGRKLRRLCTFGMHQDFAETLFLG
jgi:hypothetical protein